MLYCQVLIYTATISIASVTSISAAPAAKPSSSQKSIDELQCIACPKLMLLAANMSASSAAVAAAPMRCFSTLSSILPSVASTYTKIKKPSLCLLTYIQYTFSPSSCQPKN